MKKPSQDALRVLFAIYRLQPIFKTMQSESDLTDDEICAAMLELQMKGAAVLKMSDVDGGAARRFRYSLTDAGKCEVALMRRRSLQ